MRGMNILVVDDDSLMRKLLVQSLTAMGHRVSGAESSDEALQAVAADESLEVMITDWTMPGMTGVELTRLVRQMPNGPYLHILLLTARQTRDDYVEAIESGADDFLNKPFDPVMLVTRLRAAQRVLAMQHSLRENNALLSQAHGKLEAAYDSLRDDLEAAARVQKSLLPAACAQIGRAQFGSALFPSATVSGDIYNYFGLSDGSVGLYTVDVAGHGARAAMLSFTLSRVLTPESFETEDGTSREPHRIVAELNRRFQVRAPNLDYFTMLCGVISPQGILRFCQAGHPYPILLRHNSPAPCPIGDGGFPVALVEEAAFATTTLELHTGDRIVFHSDGVTECTAPDGEMFGPERLHALLLEYRHASSDIFLERLRCALIDWQQSETFHDDVSIMTCEWER